jgi:hypothetical protein
MSDDRKGIVRIGFEDPIQVVFPQLHEPKRVKNRNGEETGEPKYSITFLIPATHPDLKVLATTVAKVFRAKFPDAKLPSNLSGFWAKDREYAWPFTKGEDEIERLKKKAEKAGKTPRDNEFYKGMILVKARSNYQPSVLDVRPATPVEIKEPDGIKSLIYSGAYVASELNANAYQGTRDDDKDGANFYLNAVAFVKSGDRLTGVNHAETFRAVKGKSTDEDPTGGAEEEIQF